MSQQNHLYCIMGLITPLGRPERRLLTPHLSLCSTCPRPHLQHPSSPPSPWGGGGWRSSVWTACSTGAASGSWSPPSAPPHASLRCGCASPAPPCSPAPLRACRTSGSASGLLWEGRGHWRVRRYLAEVFDWEGKLGKWCFHLPLSPCRGPPVSFLDLQVFSSPSSPAAAWRHISLAPGCKGNILQYKKSFTGLEHPYFCWTSEQTIFASRCGQKKLETIPYAE